jgi:hypothetical protein
VCSANIPSAPKPVIIPPPPPAPYLPTEQSAAAVQLTPAHLAPGPLGISGLLRRDLTIPVAPLPGAGLTIPR